MNAQVAQVPQVMVTRNVEIEANWGKLVLKWALDSSSYPTSLAEFNKQTEAAGVTFENLAGVKGVQFVQNNSEVLLIRLPPKDLAADAKRRMESNQVQEPYSIPQFYEFFCGPLHVAPDDRLKLLACRIGDYSIANCG